MRRVRVSQGAWVVAGGMVGVVGLAACEAVLDTGDLVQETADGGAVDGTVKTGDAATSASHHSSTSSNMSTRVRLSRGGAKHLGAEPCHVIAGHAGGNHFNGTAGEAEIQRPQGVFAAPVVQFLQGGRNNSLLAQLSLQLFIHRMKTFSVAWVRALQSLVQHWFAA